MKNDQLLAKVAQKEQFKPAAKIGRDGKTVSFGLDTEIVYHRVQTLFSKDPQTIEWIASFDEGDGMVDIGANIGLYALWAAVTKNARVYAFEPESQNYAVLNRNIKLNDASGRVTAFCLALSDEEAFDVLNLNQFVVGGSCHSFEEEVNSKLKPRKAAFKQGCFGVPLDMLVKDKVVDVPHHIKIDVDGLEHRVIAGMAKTLARKSVKSINIEIDTNLAQHSECLQVIRDHGFELNEDLTQASLAITKGTPFDGIGNHYFHRQGKA